MVFARSVVIFMSMCAVIAVASLQEPKRLRPYHIWPVYPLLHDGNPHYHPQSPQESEKETSLVEPRQALNGDINVDNEEVEINEDPEIDEELKAIPQKSKRHPPHHIYPHYPYVPHGNPHNHPQIPQESENKASLIESRQVLDSDVYVDNDDIEHNMDLKINEELKTIPQKPTRHPPYHINPHYPYVPYGHPHYHPQIPQKSEKQVSLIEPRQVLNSDVNVDNEEVEVNEDLEFDEVKSIPQKSKRHPPHHIYPHYPHVPHSNSHYDPEIPQASENQASLFEPRQILDDNVNADNEDVEANEDLDIDEEVKAIPEKPKLHPPHHIYPHYPYLPHGQPQSPQEMEYQTSLTEPSQDVVNDTEIKENFKVNEATIN